jgi:iron-sulfur cluster repair protein YtfE (RIC family)
MEKEAILVEDKTFELLEKMYVEFSEFRNETRDELQGLKNDIVRIENVHGKKLDALFDGYKQLTEGQDEIKSQLKELSSKVEKEDMQITVLKGNKKTAK